MVENHILNARRSDLNELEIGVNGANESGVEVTLHDSVNGGSTTEFYKNATIGVFNTFAQNSDRAQSGDYAGVYGNEQSSDLENDELVYSAPLAS